MPAQLFAKVRLRALEYAEYEGNVQEPETVYGETVHFQPNANSVVDPSEAIVAWYQQQEAQYDYNNPHYDAKYKDFLQLASATTKRYACSQSMCTGSKPGVYTVCFYDPKYEAGNEAQNIIEPAYELEGSGFASDVFLKSLTLRRQIPQQSAEFELVE